MDKITNDRDNAIKWARKLFEDAAFVVFDTETTGLDSAAEIMQFAFVNHDASNAIQFDVCPSERATLDERAFRVHGITLESVATAPPITIWAQNIIDIIKGNTVITWNASFDYRMLVQSFGAWQVEPPSIIHLANFECAMLQYAKYFGDWDMRCGQYRLQKLPGATHGALADCHAVLAVLQEMANARLSTEPEPTPATPEPEPPTIRTIAFEHGHGSVTLGPPPDETTSTTVEVDHGDDPAANGYTFNMFGGTEPEPNVEPATIGELANLMQLLNLAGAPLTREIVAAWTNEQRAQAATYAAMVIVAELDLALTGFGQFPPRPDFIPPAPAPAAE